MTDVKYYSCNEHEHEWTLTCPKKALRKHLEGVGVYVEEMPKVYVAWTDTLDDIVERMALTEDQAVEFEVIRRELSDPGRDYHRFKEYTGGGLQLVLDDHNEEVANAGIDLFLDDVPFKRLDYRAVCYGRRNAARARRVWKQLRGKCPPPLASWGSDGSLLFTWGELRSGFWLELKFDCSGSNKTGLEYFERIKSLCVTNPDVTVDVDMSEQEAIEAVKASVMAGRSSEWLRKVWSREPKESKAEAEEELGEARVRLHVGYEVVLNDEVGAGYELNESNIMRALEPFCQGLSVELVVKKTIRDTYKEAMSEGFAECEFSLSDHGCSLELWRCDD